MKKYLSIVLLIAVLLSCCACGQKQTATEPATEATESVYENGYLTQEEQKPDYSYINEFEPNADGVYQIHTKEGFLNIQNHPDGNFELLWHIDLEGSEWTPLGTEAAPFTGSINGGYYTVSNLVINTPTADGNMGFFGVFSGTVEDMDLANVAVTTTADTKRVGVWCGYNAGGTLLRSDLVSCQIEAAKLASDALVGGAVGLNEGELRNATVSAGVHVTASGSATVGGMVGVTNASVEFLRNEESIIVTGCDNKTVGLIVGSLEGDAAILSATFLGEENTKDDKLFTDLIGAGDITKVSECSYRVNSREPEDPTIQAMRDIVEADMRAQGTIEWTVSEPLVYSCYCELVNCYGSFYPGTTVRGILYNHKACSLERMEYVLDENNVFLPEVGRLGEFDGMDCYMGNDCSTSVASAYRRVIGTIDFNYSKNMFNGVNESTVHVGQWPSAQDFSSEPAYTDKYVEAVGEQGMYENYALMRKADFIVHYNESGGHVRMAAADPVVVRYQDGTINGTESYVLMHEQGAPRTYEPYYSSWRIDYKYTFANLYTNWYLPLTAKEFVTGEFETPMAELRDGTDGKPGMTTGTVYSNFFLDSVSLTVTDSKGNTVFDHRIFTTVSKYWDDATRLDLWIRRDMHEYDLGGFAVPLQETVFQKGETYSYTVTAHVGSGDAFTVKEGSFTHGSV